MPLLEYSINSRFGGAHVTRAKCCCFVDQSFFVVHPIILLLSSLACYRTMTVVSSYPSRSACTRARSVVRGQAVYTRSVARFGRERDGSGLRQHADEQQKTKLPEPRRRQEPSCGLLFQRQACGGRTRRHHYNVQKAGHRRRVVRKENSSMANPASGKILGDENEFSLPI